MAIIDLSSLINKKLIPRDSNQATVAPLVGIDPVTGEFVPLKLSDNGDGTYSLDVGLTVGSVSIGSVKLEDGTTTAKATIQAAPGGENALITQSVGSANAYFCSESVTALTGTFQNFVFGFTSFSISLYNDDYAEQIQFSFDGISVHGQVNVGEAVAMDYRSQPGIYLRTVGGNAANYRLSSY